MTSSLPFCLLYLSPLINLWVPTPAKALVGILEEPHHLFPGRSPVSLRWLSRHSPAAFPMTQLFLSALLMTWPGPVSPLPWAPLLKLVLRMSSSCGHDRLCSVRYSVRFWFPWQSKNHLGILSKGRGKALKFCISNSLMVLMLPICQPHIGSKDMDGLFYL